MRGLLCHLAGYAEFVARVRENEKGMPLGEAVTRAIRGCIREGILAGFLEENSSEVRNMLLEEWNWEEAKEVWWEEAREMAEAKYQPVLAEKDLVLAEKDRRIAEKDLALAEKDRRIEELRRKLRGQ